ncbi:MAG TPA: hypothetical protein VGL42_01470 [Opitutaceae bacterium]
MTTFASRLTLKFLGGASVLLGAASLAQAQIPYPTPGTPNTAVYSFTASATGDVVGFFGGSGASFDEQVGLLDDGVMTSGGFGLDDHSSAIGQMFDFGMVHAGDTLTFVDKINGTNLVYSNPALNAPYDALGGGILGVNISTEQHVYSVAASANEVYAGSPAGIYLGFEDEAFPGSDYNYHDDTFVFTNVGVRSAPDAGSSLLLLVIGGAALLAASRRKPVRC